MPINWDAIEGAGQSAPAQIAPPKTSGINWDAIKTTQSTPEQVAPQQQDESWWHRQRGGLASAPINAYLGVKQYFGGLSPEEQSVLAQNKDAASKAPAASLLSNLGMFAPTMLIPGANTITGAGVVGAVNGLAQPVAGEQSAANIAKGKLINGLLGGAVGAGGAAVMGSAANSAANNLADSTATAAANASRNSVRDATLAAGRNAGYVVPNSAVAPTFWGNRMESIGGKAAIKQNATINNQQATNSLARRALGQADDTPLSDGLLDTIRTNVSGPYREVAGLPPRPPVSASSVTNTPADPGFDPAAALQQLRQSRNDAQAWYRSYGVSANPEHQAAANAAQAQADGLEQALHDHAISQGRPDLIPQLVDARRQIAQTYTVGRALNDATGDVNAKVIGRDFANGKPLTDGLDTIGRFSTGFPQFTGPAASTPAAGVSKSEALSSALLGMGGAAATGSPWGLVAGATPLASHLARSLALRPGLQATPTYEASMLARMLAAPSAGGLTAVTQGLAAYGIPQLTAQ